MREKGGPSPEEMGLDSEDRKSLEDLQREHARAWLETSVASARLKTAQRQEIEHFNLIAEDPGNQALREDHEPYKQKVEEAKQKFREASDREGEAVEAILRVSADGEARQNVRENPFREQALRELLETDPDAVEVLVEVNPKLEELVERYKENEADLRSQIENTPEDGTVM